jgi:hypothetical protein
VLDEVPRELFRERGELFLGRLKLAGDRLQACAERLHAVDAPISTAPSYSVPATCLASVAAEDDRVRVHPHRRDELAQAIIRAA